MLNIDLVVHCSYRIVGISALSYAYRAEGHRLFAQDVAQVNNTVAQATAKTCTRRIYRYMFPNIT